jgi:glyoxylase-like metal-dependent hydrolase (beta-lactamase superfamily II)
MMQVMDSREARNEWTRPGLFEVAPGVHRIPLPLPNDGLAAVNAYAVVDGDRLVLIDPGWGLTEAREQLADALGHLGAGFGDVTRFLVTHHHRDHYTQAVLLRREFGITVELGAEEKHSLLVAGDPDADIAGAHAAGLRRAGAQALGEELRKAWRGTPRDAGVWESPDTWLVDGQDCGLHGRALTAIATPGHTRGHLVFRDAEAGLLFAGDHVLPHITPSIGFETVPAELPLGDFLDSLRLVRSLPDTRLLPAHGPVAESTHARIDELLEHHRTRLDAMHGAIVQGATTAFEAAGLVTWTRRQHKLDELNLFNRVLAIMETLAHLDLLAVQGRLRVGTNDGVRHFTAA